ncbi:MAG: helicase-related protein, partial [Pseudomonadota bacterium]
MTLAAREALQPNRLGEPVLPIDARREEIIDALKRHQVIIVSGETGSGKTTQLPRLALAAGFGRRGMIGHTQPRRIAARSVANRLAVETGLALGEGIGFAVRFDDRTSDLSLVRVMTDGILLNDVQRDRMLSRYEVLIIDEAHERSLNIDFLLGIIKTLLPRRPDLKVIITSATIDHERFASFFENAPVIEVSGRSYPVKIEYADASIASDDSRELSRAVCDSVQTLLQRSLPSLAQDILVFLPGEREIRDCERALRKRGLLPAASWEILPLYGRLSDTLQQQVFKPGKQRRVVLATNVAETSLTVPRIGAVIDSGLARLKRYSSRTRIERLQVEAVSQASANQRAGRCGRIGPGICLRLFSQADFEARSEFTDAEILRSNLASVALQLEAMRLPGLDRFALLDRPDPSRIEDARRLLVELGALHRHKGITKLGKRLSRLPLDPRLGRMLLAPMPERLMPALVICVAG